MLAEMDLKRSIWLAPSSKFLVWEKKQLDVWLFAGKIINYPAIQWNEWLSSDQIENERENSYFL